MIGTLRNDEVTLTLGDDGKWSGDDKIAPLLNAMGEFTFEAYSPADGDPLLFLSSLLEPAAAWIKKNYGLSLTVEAMEIQPAPTVPGRIY